MLFGRDAVPPAELESRRATAELLLEAAQALHLDALGVGRGDLVFGLDFLREGARRHGLPYVSANLADGSGDPVFPTVLLVEVGGLRVGVTSVLPAGPPGLGVLPVDPALQRARAELDAQRPDLRVLLTNHGATEGEALGERFGFDLVFASSTRRHQEVPRVVGRTAVFEAGSRGKSVGLVRVELVPAATGWVVDGARAAVERQRRSLETQLERSRTALGTADATARQRLERTIALAESRLAALELPAEPSGPRNRLRDAGQAPMGADLADEPAMRALVDRYLAGPAGTTARSSH